jgi:hypothetical protein
MNRSVLLLHIKVFAIVPEKGHDLSVARIASGLLVEMEMDIEVAAREFCPKESVGKTFELLCEY